MERSGWGIRSGGSAWRSCVNEEGRAECAHLVSAFFRSSACRTSRSRDSAALRHTLSASQSRCAAVAAAAAVAATLSKSNKTSPPPPPPSPPPDPPAPLAPSPATRAALAREGDEPLPALAPPPCLLPGVTCTLEADPTPRPLGCASSSPPPAPAPPTRFPSPCSSCSALPLRALSACGHDWSMSEA